MKRIFMAMDMARRLTRDDLRVMTMLLVTPLMRLTVAVLVIKIVARVLSLDAEGPGVASAVVAATLAIALSSRQRIEDFGAAFHDRIAAEDARRLAAPTEGIEVSELVDEAKAEDRLKVSTDGLEARDATDEDLVVAHAQAVFRGDVVAAVAIEGVIDLAAYKAAKAAREVQDAAG